MTAVAVVTPSSGSNSAAMLPPCVLGADTGVLLSSSHAAPWPSCALLLWRALACFDPGRPVFDRSPRALGSPSGKAYAREPLPRTGPRSRRGVTGPVRRGAGAEGG